MCSEGREANRMGIVHDWSTGERGASTARGRLVTDGGETFCVACGEAFDPQRDTCPACGRPTDGEEAADTTPESPQNSPDETPSAVKAPEPEATSESASTQQADDQQELEPAADTPQQDRTDPDATPKHSHASGDRSRQSETAGANEEYCRKCGGVVTQAADQCPHCGVDRTSSGKRPILAGIMSLIVIGSGQAYNGDYSRGFGFFAGAVILYIGSLPVLDITLPVGGADSIFLLALWAWAGYDAYTGATA